MDGVADGGHCREIAASRHADRRRWGGRFGPLVGGRPPEAIGGRTNVRPAADPSGGQSRAEERVVRIEGRVEPWVWAGRVEDLECDREDIVGRVIVLERRAECQ